MLMDPDSNERPMVNQMRRLKGRIANFIFIAAILALTLYLIFTSVDIKEFSSIIGKSEASFFILGLLCIVGYWLIEIGIIHHFLRKVYSDIGIWVSVKSVMVGQYYSHLTPFASGSQPMQAYYMGRDGVSVAVSGAVLVGKFLLFQLTVTLYAALTVLLRLSSVLSGLHQAATFVIVGLVVNLAGLSLIIGMAYKPGLIRLFLNFVIYVLTHVKVIKNPEAKYESVKEHLKEYIVSLRHLTKNKWELAMLFLASAVQVTVFFTIPWFVYRGLGLSGADYFHIVSMASLLYIAVAFMPMPGAAGASEVGFTVMMGSIFTSSYTAVGMLIWRGISFYFSFVFCGIFTLLIHALDAGRKEKLAKRDLG
jgi:glycosyltransferase 2 family protein